MEIYVADVCTVANEEALLEMCRLLPAERREQTQKYRNYADKKRCVGAGLLLEYGLQQHGFTLRNSLEGKTCVSLTKGLYGKPYILGKTDVHFNLSHSGNYVAVVFAAGEIGIDIECERKANMSLAKRFFSREEYAYLESVQRANVDKKQIDAAFVRLWTRKESYIKAVGEGMHLPLNDFCALSDVESSEEIYRIKSWTLQDGGFLSVCAKEEINAEPKQIDLSIMI